MERIVPGQEKETGASRQEGREPPVLSEACSFSTQPFVGKAPKGRDGNVFPQRWRDPGGSSSSPG